MKKNLIDKFFVFFSASFSGGYKIFAISVITFLSSNDFLVSFNTIYFVTLLCVSLSIMPLASLMTAKNFEMSVCGKVFFLFVFSMLSCLIAAFFGRYIDMEVTPESILTIFVCTLLLGFYEVIRRQLSNSSDFSRIFYAGVVSTFMFFSILFLNDTLSVNSKLTMFFFSFCFSLPIIMFLFRTSGNSYFFGGFDAIGFMGKYASAFFSNATSSLVSFALPLIIIYFLKSDVSPFLGVIFSASSFFLLFPRYMAEKNLPKMRVQENFENLTSTTYSHTVRYLIIVSIVSSIAFFLSNIRDYQFYFLLFISFQVSQLALPYANVLMVKGDFATLSRCNFISLLPYFLLAPIFFLNINSIISCYIVVVLYISSSIIKTLLVKKYCRRFFSV